MQIFIQIYGIQNYGGNGKNNKNNLNGKTTLL